MEHEAREVFRPGGLLFCADTSSTPGADPTEHHPAKQVTGPALANYPDPLSTEVFALILPSGSPRAAIARSAVIALLQSLRLRVIDVICYRQPGGAGPVRWGTAAAAVPALILARFCRAKRAIRNADRRVSPSEGSPPSRGGTARRRPTRAPFEGNAGRPTSSSRWSSSRTQAFESSRTRRPGRRAHHGARTAPHRQLAEVDVDQATFPPRSGGVLPGEPGDTRTFAASRDSRPWPRRTRAPPGPCHPAHPAATSAPSRRTPGQRRAAPQVRSSIAQHASCAVVDTATLRTTRAPRRSRASSTSHPCPSC